MALHGLSNGRLSIVWKAGVLLRSSHETPPLAGGRGRKRYEILAVPEIGSYYERAQEEEERS